MRIAVITDVHGNSGALEAVLAHSERLGVDETVVAGDTVNILPHSKACWDLVRSRGVHLLLGNHELYVATYGTPEADPVWTDERFRGLAWVQSQFGVDDLLAMRGLPLTYRLPGLVVTHASPRSVYDSVEENTPEGLLREMFGVPETLGVPEMLVVRGHNHSWLERRWDERTLVTVAFVRAAAKGAARDAVRPADAIGRPLALRKTVRTLRPGGRAGVAGRALSGDDGAARSYLQA